MNPKPGFSEVYRKLIGSLEEVYRGAFSTPIACTCACAVGPGGCSVLILCVMEIERMGGGGPPNGNELSSKGGVGDPPDTSGPEVVRGRGAGRGLLRRCCAAWLGGGTATRLLGCPCGCRRRRQAPVLWARQKAKASVRHLVVGLQVAGRWGTTKCALWGRLGGSFGGVAFTCAHNERRVRVRTEACGCETTRTVIANRFELEVYLLCSERIGFLHASGYQHHRETWSSYVHHPPKLKEAARSQADGRPL
jgi:hypothetical protein